MALYTKEPINGSKQEVNQTLAHFKRSRKAAAIASVLSLSALLFSIYVLVPEFFTHFWLIIPLFFTLLFAKSYGAWDAYVSVRENSEELEVALLDVEVRTNNHEKGIKNDK